MIDGPTIIVASGGDQLLQDNGKGSQLFFGRDAKESLVLGDTMKSVLTTYSTNVQAAFDSLSSALIDFCNKMSLPTNSAGNLGVPIPGLALLPPVLSTKTAEIKQKLDSDTESFKTDLTKTLSRLGKTK
jgi:hypothetical protein